MAERSLSVALAHDWLVGMRGGEFVLDRLAQQFGPTRLYTLVHDRAKTHALAIEACEIVTSPLQRFPGAAGRQRRAYLPLMPWAVEGLRVVPCDLLISTSSAVMKSIVPPPQTPHLCYCHSPARYLWGMRGEYASGAGGALRGLGLRVLQRRFREWDRRTSHRVTRFLANSRHTAQRIADAYDRESTVVYPPVRTNFFTIDERVQREEWYLVVAALEPYKRTHLVAEAATRSGYPLKIAGTGSQYESLCRQAARSGGRIETLGRVSDETLRDLYRSARALIFPQEEDFGIIAVEAQACGCPVIAFAGGGALETVTNDTGAFFESASVDAIISAINSFEQRSFHFAACRTNAERFAETRFDEAIARHVEELLAR